MAGPGLVRLADLGEAGRGELPKRFQQPEATSRRGVDQRHHRSLDEIAEQPVHIDRVEVVAGADRLRGSEVEGPDERGEPAEQTLLVGLEEVVGPGHGGLQRRLPLRSVAPVSEQAEAVAEPVEQLRRRQAAGARRRELDRERHAVQLSAHLLHGVPLGLEVEVRGHGTGALEEQVGAVLGRVEGFDGMQVLAHRAEPFARGREQAGRRRARTERVHQRGRARQHVLAVVEDHERGPGSHGRHDRGSQVTICGLGDPQGLGHCVDDLLRARHLVELDHGDAAAVGVLPRTGDGDGKTRLADPSRPQQGDERRGAQRGEHHPDVGVAADEIRDGGQVVLALRRCGRGAPNGYHRRRDRTREDLRLELPKSFARVDPEAVDEVDAGALEGRQRICLPIAPRQREHQRRPQALAERVDLRELGQRPDGGPGIVVCETGQLLLRRVEPPFLQSVDGGLQPDGVQPCERWSGPHHQRAVRVAIGCELDEARDVHVHGGLEPVGRADPGDRVGAEGLAQRGHVSLEDLGSGARRLLTPDQVDQS